MAEYLIQDTTLTSIADAIREKTGKTELLSPAQMATEISGITGGGGGVEEGGIPSKAVNFYDQFGNIMYSYTRAEAAALTELPPGPEIEGFEFDAWTYTLDQIQSVKFFADIGPMYKKNGVPCGVLILDIPAHELSTCLSVACGQASPAIKAYVDWGDGAVTTITGSTTATQYESPSHTYSEPGLKYVAVYTSSQNQGISMGYTVGSRYHSMVKDTTSSYIATSSYSKTNYISEYKLVSALGGTVCRFAIVSGHQNLRIISSAWFTDLSCVIGHSPKLEVIDTANYNYAIGKNLLYTPKLRRALLSISASKYDDTLQYSDNMTDIYMGATGIAVHAYVLPKMNVGRRIIIDHSSLPTQPSTVTHIQWGDGLIYVRDDLVETFKTNELFAPVVNCIRPISEYPDY